MSFLGRLGNDITHPFGLGQPQQAPRPAPIRTPAPGMRPQQQIARTAPMPPQAPAAPHMNLFQRFGNTLHNDVVAPIQRDIVHPIQQAPRAFDQAAVRSPLGRGAQAATLGIAQAGVEGAQGIAGLGDALNHRLGNYQGQSPVSRGLTNIAKNIDVTAKAEHSNPLLYHGSQVGANIAGALATGGLSDAVKVGAAFPKLGAAINIASKLNPEAKIANAVAGKTAGLAEKGLPGRIAANSIKNIASPKYQAGNAAFTALQAGQQIAQGRKVTPANVATNLAIGAVGLPVAGAVGKEAAAPVVKGAQTALQIAKNLGLKPPTSLNDSELNSARKILSAREGLTDSSGLTVQDTHNFHNAQIKLGAKPGTPDGMNAISNALDAHHAFNQQVQQRVQSLNAVKQGALKFAQDHPIGMTSGAVDESGNKLGLDGKPLNVPTPKADPQAALKQEALKYKSADEFKNAVRNGDIKFQKGTAGSTDQAISKAEMQDIINTHRQRFGDSRVQFGKGESGTMGTYNFHKDMIRIADGGKGTFDHESIHKAIGQFLPDKQIEQLYKDVVKVSGGKLRLQAHYAQNGYKGITWRGAAEEEIANIFADYVKNGAVKSGFNDGHTFTKAWLFADKHGLPTSIVDTLENLYNKILDTYSGKARAAASGRLKDFYDQVERGDFKGAPRRDFKYEAPTLRNKVVGAAEKALLGEKIRIENGTKKLVAGSPNSDGQQLTDLYNQAHAEAKTPGTPVSDKIQKTEAPAPAETAPTNAKPPKVVQNSLTQGAKQNRQNLSPETIAQVSGEHAQRNTRQLADTSAANVDKLPTNTAIEQAHGMLAQPLGHVTDEQTGFIAKTIEKADSEATKARQAGDTVTADRLSRESATLHDGLSEHASARGQANQALTMLYNRSPQGLYHTAIRDLQKAGVDTSKGGLQSKLQGLADKIKTAAKPGEKTDAIATFHKAVSDTMPQNLSDKLIGIWKAGLLSGVKTQQGNAISNATFGALKKISDVPATGVDKLLSLKTGQRTKSLTGSGILGGTKEGGANAKYTLKTGIDRRSAGDKYEQHGEIDFKNPVIDKTVGKAVRGIFRGMNAADQPFWYAAFKNSMYDQAKADGLGKGLKGDALTAHMDNLVKSPTDAMANTALQEANKSTLNYDTLASKGVQAIHTSIDKAQSLNGRPVPPEARAAAHAVVNVLAPFVRVPTAFLSRTIDFTPLGIGKETMHQLLTKQLDQRALSQAIGEGLTGTGAIALGIGLTQRNMLSGDYPKNDPKEAQRWKAEGITPNSVKLGGKWINLNYLGPLGLLFNAGNKIENAKGQGAPQQVGQALAGFGSGLMGQSFLQGFSGFSNAINDPARNAKSFINSQASSIVPSIVNDVANATDKYQRQANNPLDAIKGRIPGVRNATLPTKQDVYGNSLKQPAGPLGTLLGVKPSNSLTGNSPAITEVNRLHNVNPNDSSLQVTPTPVSKSLTVEKQTVKLNDKQQYALQKQTGQALQTKWNALIKTPEYQALDDTGKAKALENLKSDVSSATQRQFLVQNGLHDYAKSATAKEAALLTNQADIASYATNVTNGTGSVRVASSIPADSKQFLTKYNAMNTADRTKAAYSNNGFDYQYAQAKYNNDKANGTLSKAADIKALAALNKDKIGADYSKDVRDLYDVNKSDLATYLSTSEPGVDKQKIASDLLAYDKALHDAGVTSSLKYKNGIASSGSGGSGSRSSGGRTASIGKAPAINYSGTSKLTNASLAAIRKSNGTKVRGGKVALKSMRLPSAPKVARSKRTSGVIV